MVLHLYMWHYFDIEFLIVKPNICVSGGRRHVYLCRITMIHSSRLSFIMYDYLTIVPNLPFEHTYIIASFVTQFLLTVS